MVERLQPAEPVEKRSTDVGLLDGATKVALTVEAAPAVDINVVEVAGLVVTEDPGGATPATETPLAETVELVKEVPFVAANAPEVVLTVGAAHAVDINVVEVAGLVVTDDPGEATTAIETPLVEAVKPVENVPIVAAKAPDAHQSGKCTICIYRPFFDVDTYRF
jgi:hypothetical protein